MLNLMLHCGAERVERTDPILAMQPVIMGNRHHPLPHLELIDMLRDSLQRQYLTVNQEQYGVTKDGQRLFGLLEVGHTDFATQEWSTVIGLRASHDQAFRAGICAGTGVFVCDNLSFVGEINFGTKQTTYMNQRMPRIIDQATGRIFDMQNGQHQRVDNYKNAPLSAVRADAMITDFARQGAITPSQVGRVIAEWDNPTHDAFDDRNLWSLYNAVTQIYKPRNEHTNMGVLPERSIKLTEYCDNYVRH